MEKLTKAQHSVLNLIFVGKKTEEDALGDANISLKIYEGWFRQPAWNAEYTAHIKRCKRRAEQLIANSQQKAAEMLISLTDSDKDDVSRKACLDILEMEESEGTRPKDVEQKSTLSKATQQRILKLMAKDK